MRMRLIISAFELDFTFEDKKFVKLEESFTVIDDWQFT